MKVLWLIIWYILEQNRSSLRWNLRSTRCLSYKMITFRNTKIILFTSLAICLCVACTGNGIERTLPASGSTQIQETPLSTSTKIEPGQTKRVREKDGMTTIFISAGSFQMGSTDDQVIEAIKLCWEHYHICNRWYYERETPLHEVSLEGFWIDQIEVSNTQYQLCVDVGNCSSPIECKKGQPQ